MRSGPHSGVAGLHRSWQRWEEGFWKSNRRVRVRWLRQGRDLRSVGLVVQAPRDAQVASVLVHAAHVPSASISQGATLIHIWNTERCIDQGIQHLWPWDPFHPVSLGTHSTSHATVFLLERRLYIITINRTFHKMRVDSPKHCLALRSYAKPSVQVWGEMIKKPFVLSGVLTNQH